MEKTYLFNYEDGTPIGLYDSLSLVTGLLQDSYKFPIITYQEIIRLLSRDYKTPIKRFIRLLSRDYKTPIKRLQDSYQGFIRLL